MEEALKQIDRQVHFIGIGGIGMSGIALLLLRRGIKVSGSDLKENKNTQELKNSGADIFIGHEAANIGKADAVVYSSAIKTDNPEIIEARRLGVPVLKRAEALAGLMKDKLVITVTGSHGKTTTSSLVSYLLSEAGLNPTAAIGGILKNINTNVYSGNGNFFVAEADESDGSFLFFKPRYSIITNIDHEHLDYYNSFENEVKAFRQFIENTETGGCLFCSGDDANLREILKEYKGRHVLFGLGDNSQVYPKNIVLEGLSSNFDCFFNGRFIDRFNLSLGGLHNISNALSVIALGLELGIGIKIIKSSLSNYRGAGRRIEIKFKNSDFLVIDDYAHHPTEIKATLRAVKNLNPRRLIAVFQPHRYTRTKLMLDKFASSFDLADYTVVTDIYAASEPVLEGVSAKSICEKIKEYNPGQLVDFLPKQELAKHILGLMRPGDLVITLGAGDITKVCDELVEKLKR